MVTLWVFMTKRTEFSPQSRIFQGCRQTNIKETLSRSFYSGIFRGGRRGGYRARFTPTLVSIRGVIKMSPFERL